ncbi:MAG: SLC13 family permease [Candidatus Cyclobacteriaceae bacterium M2_1C_046]
MPVLNPDIQPFFLLGLIIIMFLFIYKNLVKPADAFLFATIILIITGILTPVQALEGLSNPSILSIFLLIMITAGIKNSYNLETYIYKLFNKARGYRGFLLLLMTKVALVSSVINNTPVVALMTPYVINWGKKHQISPSRLLIPLSFATIVGGMITLIGTSTTLVLNGFIMEVGGEGFRSLDLLIIGASVTVISILFITLLSSWLLPDRKDILQSFTENKREYLVEKRLQKDSPLIGQTVGNGGLRNLKGVYLVEIIRKEGSITPVSRNEVIKPNDVLIFAGNTDAILDLSDDSLGINFPKPVRTMDGHMEIVESVVSANSSLIGKTIKESDFRNRYDAAVVAVHRGGERITGKIGDIELQAGDVLLLYCGKDFDDLVDIYKDLIIISEERKKITSKVSRRHLVILAGIVLILVITQFFSLFTSLLIITGAMVAMQMITIRTLKRDLDFNMLIILVFSIALGEAMISTGTGNLMANSMLKFLYPYGILPILIGLMTVTILLTSFVSNIGAAAIVFPIAYSIALSLDIAPMPLYLTIAYAASAAFLTPIGYQTNLMVYGPGGYTFKDFLRIGFPVAIIYSVVALSMIYFLYADVLFI